MRAQQAARRTDRGERTVSPFVSASTHRPVAAALKPAPNIRQQVAARLGISDPTASNDDLFRALDARLAVKSVTNAAEAAYDIWQGQGRSTPELSATDSVLFDAAWGHLKKGAA